MDHLCYLCLVFVMLSRLFIAALWSPAGKGLTSWILFVMFNCVFVTFPCGTLGHVLISDLCRLSYFGLKQNSNADTHISVRLRGSNVVPTLMRRRDVTLTLVRNYFS